MALAVSPAIRPVPLSTPTWRTRVGRGLRVAMEVVLLALVAASPWMYGAVHPLSEFVLLAGISLLLWLWALRFLVDGQVTWRHCPVLLCLAGLFLLALWQMASLSESQSASARAGNVGVATQVAPRTAGNPAG